MIEDSVSMVEGSGAWEKAPQISAYHQMPGSCSHAPQSGAFRKPHPHLILGVKERALFCTAKGPPSTSLGPDLFQELKTKPKYNRTHSCCSYHLAKLQGVKSSGQQPGPKAKYVFLIISQYHTRQKLKFFFFFKQSLKVRQILFYLNLLNVPPMKYDHIYPPLAVVVEYL